MNVVGKIFAGDPRFLIYVIDAPATGVECVHDGVSARLPTADIRRSGTPSAVTIGQGKHRRPCLTKHGRTGL